MQYVLKNKSMVTFLLLCTMIILAIPFINFPPFWDGILWVNSAEWMSHNNLNPVLPGTVDYGGLDGSHPPFLFLILGFAFYLFGTTPIVWHIVLLLFAFLTVYFTYLLGSYLYNQKTGFIASTFLLFSPLFYAQTHNVNLDLPLAAFTIMAVYFAIKNKTLPYLIVASLLVLTKEPGALTVIAIVVYVFIKNLKEPPKILLKRCIIYSLPLLSLASWFVFHKIYQSQLLGYSAVWKPVTSIIFLRLFSRLKIFFFDGFHWVFTFIILFSLLQNPKKLLNFKRFIIIIGIGLLSLFLFTLGFNFLLNHIFLLESVILSLGKNAFYISEKNLQGVLLGFYSNRFIFAAFITILASLLINGISFSNLKNRKLVPISLTFLFYFILFSWTFDIPRYSLPLYPFFFILSTNALTGLFKKKLGYILLLILVGLLITQWFGHSEDTRGYLLEKNLEYQDAVVTHKLMAEYIEDNFPDAKILTYQFLTDELRYPHLGYVKNAIDPLDYAHYDSNTKQADFTLNTFEWYYYQCYLKKQCYTSNLVPVGKGDIRVYDKRYKEYLTTDDFDIFYYSPQSPYPKDLIKIVDDFNLKLIKRFEKNGKYTELYATENFLSEIK